MRISGSSQALLVGLFFAATAAPASAVSYVRFVVPDAAYISVRPIDSSGMVGGSWTDANGYYHGFVRTPDGTVSSVDISGAYRTDIGAISDTGTAVGAADMDGMGEHVTGVIRDVDGTVSTWDAPGSTGFTAIADINKDDTIVGEYSDGTGYHGFLRKKDGAFTSFDVPGEQDTDAQAINDQGAIAGISTWDSVHGLRHGFVRSPDGKITTFDITGERMVWITGINSSGVVAGFYDGADAVYHGFARTPDGNITIFDGPKSRGGGGTIVHGINAAGVISCSNNSGKGLIRTPDGQFTKFRVKRQPTQAGGINDNGLVAGSYGDANGFIRFP